MSAPRKILTLTGLALAIGVLAGVANAEPKNQWPFTRPADTRVLAQSANRSVDVPPRPEAKNEPPFTRFVGNVATTKGNRHGASALTLSGGSPGGIDWPLLAWIGIAATTLIGGALVVRRDTSSRASRWGDT